MSSDKKIPELFQIKTTRANFRGYKNVMFWWFVETRDKKLFGPDGSLGVEYRDVIADYEPDPDSGPYAEGAVEELFTAAEAKAFVEYLNRYPEGSNTTAERYDLPMPKNMAGFGANPVGGAVGNIGPFDVDDHGLPIKIFGYYDLEECEFDATLPDARRPFQGVRISYDAEGKRHIKPWLYGDVPPSAWLMEELYRSVLASVPVGAARPSDCGLIPADLEDRFVKHEAEFVEDATRRSLRDSRLMFFSLTPPGYALADI